MIEIGDTFNRFHRVVRDVSQQLGRISAWKSRAPTPNWTRR